MTGYIVKFDDAEIVKLSKEYGYGTPKKLIEVAVKWLSDCREEFLVPEEKSITDYLTEEYNMGHQDGLQEGWDQGYQAAMDSYSQRDTSQTVP